MTTADFGDEPREHEPRPMREVTMDELDRRAASVIAEVHQGRIAVVTRHGLPVAMILSLTDAVTLLPAEIVLNEEALDLAEVFESRYFRRRMSEYLHARERTEGPYRR